MSVELPDDIEQKIISLRHEIHMNPELSGREKSTKKRVTNLLNNSGISDVIETPSGALIVDIPGKREDKNHFIIGIRGDMDALPITEQRSDLTYMSRTSGVMHACGHDTHTAIAAGAALYFNRDENLSGTVRIIFQPSEECEPLGGREVMKEGWIDDVDVMIGFHAFPSIPSGTAGLVNGYVTAAADTFSISFIGKSSHAGFPHQGVDTIFIASAFIQLTQGLVTRQMNANDSVIVSVGMIAGGTAENIICEHTTLHGTIRSRSPEARSEVRKKLQQLAVDVATIHGAESNFSLCEGEPAILNDPRLVSIFHHAADKALGKNKLKILDPLMGSDDFGFYSEKCQSIYFFYGCYNPSEGHVHPLHTPKFGVADADMISGLKLVIAATEEFFKTRSKE